MVGLVSKFGLTAVLNVMVTPVALAFFPVPLVMMLVVVAAGVGAVVRATWLPVRKTTLPSIRTNILLLTPKVGSKATPLGAKLGSGAPLGVIWSKRPALEGEELELNAEARPPTRML